MRPNNTLTALRQLACLGLPGKSLTPELFYLLRGLVGFESGQGIFLDRQCRIADAYFAPSVPPEYIQELAEYFAENPTGDGAVVTAAMAMAGGYRVLRHSQLVAPSVMWNSEFYSRFAHRFDVGWVAQIHLRDGSEPLATLSLARPRSMRDFTRSDESWLGLAEPWLSHALAGQGRPETQGEAGEIAGEEKGLLVLGENGRMISASPDAIMLVHQAAGAATPGQRSDRDAVERFTRRIADAVMASRRGLDGPVPYLAVANVYGRFRIRGYVLNAFVPGIAPQISLHIERRMPIALRLFRAQRFLALSTRERDVCLHLVAGRSLPSIAVELGVKPSSVIHHTRSLYTRLGISTQKEVIGALLGPGAD